MLAFITKSGVVARLPLATSTHRVGLQSGNVSSVSLSFPDQIRKVRCKQSRLKCQSLLHASQYSLSRARRVAFCLFLRIARVVVGLVKVNVGILAIFLETCPENSSLFLTGETSVAYSIAFNNHSVFLIVSSINLDKIFDLRIWYSTGLLSQLLPSE